MNSDELKFKLDAAIVAKDNKNISALRGRLIQSYKKDINSLLEKSELNDEEKEKLNSLKESLKKEIEMHKMHLDARYENEFINKKAKIGSLFTTLPTAVSIATEKAKVCIDEMKEAKDKKEKSIKRVEAMKSIGLLAATPVVYLGKFALDQWYAVLGIGAAIYFHNNPAAYAKATMKASEVLGLTP